MSSSKTICLKNSEITGTSMGTTHDSQEKRRKKKINGRKIIT
jgi:hypothetical protein